MMVSQATTEQELRAQLADCYRLFDYMGWTELIWNHISLRLPGKSLYLVNPFGINYCEIRPEDLVMVDIEGNIVGESDYEPNPASFSLHGAIHSAREDVACVIHTHTTALSAVAMKEAGFDHHSFYGAMLQDQVAYHSFEGITLYDDERERMLESLGDKDVLVLRNHGVAICGRDLPAAFMLMWSAQRAAEIQIQAGAIPGPNRELPLAVRERVARDSNSLKHNRRIDTMTFDAAVQRMKLDARQPA